MTICRICEKLYEGKDRIGLCVSCSEDLELEKIFSGQRTPSYANKENFLWRGSTPPAYKENFVSRGSTRPPL